ncbi:MAG: 30S ribosomal protein S4 [Candidatus Pelagibacter sp.]|nr:30S ribosomal protein S4 [Candidatus Pelagibacter sp.]OUV98357.1 MAG: 30S ribosomal protein S4 [Candidatus Pelagibacter sp. TMED142]|tara:strand:- start:45 stop:662 length:618 start_codon:yes stop_codon:yes gene_type:complete
MSKRINAKHKVDRRLGVNLWGRPKSPFNKRAYGPGQHGQRTSAKPSDYKIQLQAKQKLKNYYGNLNERQFRNVYKEAARRKGNTGENLVGILESRLDAVIYRAKFANTVFQARQLINHGHVRVNGKRVNISSFYLSENDEVEIKDSSKQLNTILSASSSKERDVPDYLISDQKKLTAKFSRIPKFDEIPYPAIMEPNLVVEYYSR